MVWIGKVPAVTVKAPNPTVTAEWKKSGLTATATVTAKNADLLEVTILKLRGTSPPVTVVAKALQINGSGTYAYKVTGPGQFRIVAKAYAYTEYYVYTVDNGPFGPLKIPVKGLSASVIRDVFITQKHECKVKLESSTIVLPSGNACVLVEYTGYSKIKVVGGFSGSAPHTIGPTKGALAYITNGIPWYSTEACFGSPTRAGTYTLSVTVYGYRSDTGKWEQCYKGSFKVTVKAKVSSALVTSWSVSVPKVMVNQQAKAKITVNWNVASGAMPYFKAVLTLSGKSFTAQAQAYKSPFVLEVPFKAPSKPGEYHATVKLYVGGGKMAYQSVGSKTVTIEVVAPTVAWSISVNPNKVTPGGSVTITASISSGLIPGEQYRLLIKAFGKTFASQPKTFNSNSGTISAKITVPSDVSPGSYTITVYLQQYAHTYTPV